MFSSSFSTINIAAMPESKTKKDRFRFSGISVGICIHHQCLLDYKGQPNDSSGIQ